MQTESLNIASNQTPINKVTMDQIQLLVSILVVIMNKGYLSNTLTLRLK